MDGIKLDGEEQTIQELKLEMGIVFLMNLCIL